MEGQAQPLCQKAHEFGVLPGFLAAQAVVQVENAQPEVPLGSEFEEDVEQAHGVGATRDGDPHLLPRLEHAVAGNCLSDAIKLWRRHSCLPCRDSSRHALAVATECRGRSVGTSADAAGTSACVTGDVRYAG